MGVIRPLTAQPISGAYRLGVYRDIRDLLITQSYQGLEKWIHSVYAMDYSAYAMD